MHNPFLASVVKKFPPLVVALSYEGCIVFHKDNQVFRFESVVAPDGGAIVVGDSLG